METLLPGFEPSEADIIQMALDMPFGKKVDKAVAFFKNYCVGVYGGFSGGKDSLVNRMLAKRAGVYIDWQYNNTTIDPPELVRYIREHHRDVKWNNPSIGLINRMVEKGVCPTRIMRWCCHEYKECYGSNVNKVIGVRISESKSRAKMWKQITPNRSPTDNSYFLAPICYWTDEDVWRLIKESKEPYCCLYDEGFSRLGCVGCPLASVSHMAFELERYPRYKKAWKSGFIRLFKRWSGVPTKNPRPVSYIEINGKLYADKGLDEKKFTSDVWTQIKTAKEDKPININGTLYGMTKMRHFEKFLNGENFFNWWRTGGAIDSDRNQCVFEDMMEQK